MPCSRGHHPCGCPHCPTPTLATHQPPAACCRFVAVLPICRPWGARAPCCTHTAGKRCAHYLNLSGFDPSHREVGRQTARGTISSPPAHPPARAALVSPAGQHPARASAARWLQTHSGPPQRLGGAMAPRQSRAGQLAQPAGPWICTQSSKSQPSCQPFWLGFRGRGARGRGAWPQGRATCPKQHHFEPGIGLGTTKLA